MNNNQKLEHMHMKHLSPNRCRLFFVINGFILVAILLSMWAEASWRESRKSQGKTDWIALLNQIESNNAGQTTDGEKAALSSKSKHDLYPIDDGHSPLRARTEWPARNKHKKNITLLYQTSADSRFNLSFPLTNRRGAKKPRHNYVALPQSRIERVPGKGRISDVLKCIRNKSLEKDALKERVMLLLIQHLTPLKTLPFSSDQGVRIGMDEDADPIQQISTKLVGNFACPVLLALEQTYGVSHPVTEEICRIIDASLGDFYAMMSKACSLWPTECADYWAPLLYLAGRSGRIDVLKVAFDKMEELQKNEDAFPGDTNRETLNKEALLINLMGALTLHSPLGTEASRDWKAKWLTIARKAIRNTDKLSLYTDTQTSIAGIGNNLTTQAAILIPITEQVQRELTTHLQTASPHQQYQELYDTPVQPGHTNAFDDFSQANEELLSSLVQQYAQNGLRLPENMERELLTRLSREELSATFLSQVIPCLACCSSYDYREKLILFLNDTPTRGAHILIDICRNFNESLVRYHCQQVKPLLHGRYLVTASMTLKGKEYTSSLWQGESKKKAQILAAIDLHQAVLETFIDLSGPEFGVGVCHNSREKVSLAKNETVQSTTAPGSFSTSSKSQTRQPCSYRKVRTLCLEPHENRGTAVVTNSVVQDYKQQLQDWCNKYGWSSPEYAWASTGAPHNPLCKVTVETANSVGEQHKATALDYDTHKNLEQIAAFQMRKRISCQNSHRSCFSFSTTP